MSFQLLFLIVLAGLVGPLLSAGVMFQLAGEIFAGLTGLLSLRKDDLLARCADKVKKWTAKPLMAKLKFTPPLVVGEILAGIVFGNSGFHWIDPAEPTFTFLSLFGFATLLFIVGVKLPLRDENLRSALGGAFKAAVLSFAVALPLGFALAYFSKIPNPGLFVLLCACSSTSTVVPMLLGRNLTGRVIMLTTAWIAICDIGTMVALPLVTASGHTMSVAGGVIIVSAAAVACFVGMRFLRSSDAGTTLRQMSKKFHWALDLRLSMAMLLGLAYLAQQFGTSVLVAGFAGGMVASSLGHPRRYYKQLIGLGEGFIVPLFFVHLGASIDVRELFTSLSNIELAVLIAGASICSSVLAARFAGLPRAAGLAHSASMGLPSAVVSIGLTTGFLTAGQGAAILAAALIALVASLYGVTLLERTDGVVIDAKPTKEKKIEADEDDHSDEE